MVIDLMTTVSRPLAHRMLIVPNSAYFFGERHDVMRPLGVVRSFECGSIATIYLTEIGAVGCEFGSGSPLASIPVLHPGQSGIVSEEIMDNNDRVVDLQVSRVTFANFIAAAVFGRICERNNHRTLEGATYCGADRIFAFGLDTAELLLPDPERDGFLEVIAPKVRRLRAGQDRHRRFMDADLADAESFIGHLLQRGDEFEYADLQSCIVMNYQAAILHGQQHAAASLALNVAVMESLVHEIFLAYGIVGDRSPRPFANRGHSVQRMSNGRFDDMRFNRRLQALRDGRLLEDHVYARIETARLRRNSLMHGGERISSRESGECQTAVRDLWTLLIDGPFALNAGWTYRY